MSSAIDLQIERLSFTNIEIPRTPIRRTIADTKNAPTSDEMTLCDATLHDGHDGWNGDSNDGGPNGRDCDGGDDCDGGERDSASGF